MLEKRMVGGREKLRLIDSNRASRAVAGAAGDLFPHLFIDLVRILLDRKILAARRAAKGDGASADPELDFLAAGLAFHENLKKNRRQVPVNRNQEKNALRSITILSWLLTPDS
jgi:hypothetical protein